MKLLATTAIAAAVVGAGQLGVAYGLSMVRLDQDIDVTASEQWTSQLAWVTWIAMSAAAIGAIVATGLRPRWRPQPIGTGGALAIGLAAGLGSLAVLPLTMQPARSAQVAGVNEVFIIGVCATLGAAVGVFAAWAAAAKAVARWNLGTLTALVWLVALASVVPSLLPGRTPIEARLGVLEGRLIPAAVAEHTPFVTMPLLALLSGLVLGWIARGRHKSTAAVALTGLAGPALLTMAYLVAGPGAEAGFRLSPYWAAMTASGAGVLGSVLAAILRGAPSRASTSAPTTGTTEDEPKPAPAPRHASAAAPSPAPTAAAHAPTPSGTAPSRGPAALPRRDAPSQSAIAAAAVAAQRPEEQLRPSDTGVVHAGDRPHPLADLADRTPANAVASPFTSGSGTPFGQPAHHGQAHGLISPAPAAPSGPRFSGQQPDQAVAPAAASRRGWRTRKQQPTEGAPPQAAPAPGNAPFDGFATTQPAPRTGIDTAELPRVAGAPGRPPARPGAPTQPGSPQESEYVNWVNGLGSA